MLIPLCIPLSRYRRPSAIGVVAAAVFLGGCATYPADDVDADPILVPAQTGDAGALTQALTGTEGATEVSYRETVGGASPRRIVVKRSAAEAAAGAQWQVERTSEGKPHSLLTFVRQSDGGVALASVIDFEEEVQTTFSPPMLTSPASIGVGDQHAVTQKLSMRVLTLDRTGKPTSKVKAEGPASVTLVYLGAQPLAEVTPITAARERPRGLLLRSTLTADFGTAKLTTVTRTWFALRPSEGEFRPGIIAEQRRENVRALGLSVRNKSVLWLAESR